MEGNLFNIISLFLAVISLVAIVLSIIAYKQSTRAALKVSSKEHEMSENLKYEVLELIAILNAIDEKAGLLILPNKKKDYSSEIDSLLRMQSHPEFLIWIRSIKDDIDRNNLESFLGLLVSDSSTDEEKRMIVYLSLYIIRKQVNLDDLVKQIEESYSDKWNQTVKELCDLSGHFFSYGYKRANSYIYFDFISFLAKEKPIDYEIMDYYSLTSIEDNIDAVKKMVFLKYADDYINFFNRLFSSFVIYLVETKQIKDKKINPYYLNVKEQGDCHYIDRQYIYSDKYLLVIVKYIDEFEDFRENLKVRGNEKS